MKNQAPLASVFALSAVMMAGCNNSQPEGTIEYMGTEKNADFALNGILHEQDKGLYYVVDREGDETFLYVTAAFPKNLLMIYNTAVGHRIDPNTLPEEVQEILNAVPDDVTSDDGISIYKVHTEQSTDFTYGGNRKITDPVSGLDCLVRLDSLICD